VELALAVKIAESVVAWARVQIREVPGTPERAVQSEYLLFGRDVLLGRYFNVDSNKCSNRKQANFK
jgi:hypothetical protein